MSRSIFAGVPRHSVGMSAVLSASEWNQIFVPEGFAHGYCTREPDTEVLKKK
jgi:dTDP-4-dehydrorhamnose 3,5-epimerase